MFINLSQTKWIKKYDFVKNLCSRLGKIGQRCPDRPYPVVFFHFGWILLKKIAFVSGSTRNHAGNILAKTAKRGIMGQTQVVLDFSHARVPYGTNQRL